VRLWCLPLAQVPLAAMLAQISGAERQRAERFGRRDDFERFVKTRGALRVILAACTGASAHSLDFVEGGGRKPQLCDNPAGVQFSVSHSAAYALVGVGRQPLGVDIECMVPDIDWEAIAGGFHPRERLALRAPSVAARTEAFFQIWTLKEAYLKGSGRGVAVDLARFAVDPNGGPVADSAEPSATPWHAHALAAPAGCKAALAVALRAPKVCDDTLSFSGFPAWLRKSSKCIEAYGRSGAVLTD
jgi:4'-phosphopantetheinyl transferase